MTLRPYQQSAVNAAIQYMRRSVSPCMIEAATGAGKSHIIAEVARQIHATTGKRVLCLAPSAELVTQNFAKYVDTGNKASMFSASTGRKETRHPVVFGSPLTVKNNLKRFRDDFALVVIDECFTAGHLVDTPTGKKPIEMLKVGDRVCNVMGNGEVLKVFRRPVTMLINVELTDGTKIRCTESHPFLTARGWVPAANLMVGEVCFRKEDMPNLLAGVSAKEASTPKDREALPHQGISMDVARSLF